MKRNTSATRFRSLIWLVPALSTMSLSFAASPACADPPDTEALLDTAIASPPYRLPRGSFVKEPVRSIEELNRHLIEHPEVAQRYARLINMSPKMIRMAFSRLRLVTLPRDTYLDIYYCHITPKGEVIGYRHRRVLRGSKVFAFPDGTPVMLQICGNPTRAFRDVTYSSTTANPNPPSMPVLNPNEDDIVRTAPEIAMTPRDINPIDDFEEVPVDLLYVPEQPTLPPDKLASYSENNLYEWARRVKNPGTPFVPILGGLLGATALALALSNHNGNNSPSPIPSIPSTPNANNNGGTVNGGDISGTANNNGGTVNGGNANNGGDISGTANNGGTVNGGDISGTANNGGANNGGTVGGSIGGDVGANVGGNVGGNVGANIGGNIGGNVGGNIGGNVGQSIGGINGVPPIPEPSSPTTALALAASGAAIFLLRRRRAHLRRNADKV